jgi:hypothetical protein
MKLKKNDPLKSHFKIPFMHSSLMHEIVLQNKSKPTNYTPPSPDEP